MTERLAPELCVIGGGVGGLTAALAAARGGISVVLVERARPGGGDLPLQALLAAAGRAEAVRTAGDFGLAAADPLSDADADLGGVFARAAQAAAALAPNAAAERLRGLGIRLIQGHAAFKDPRTVVVGDAYEIAARHVIVATGSSPALPPIDGLDQGPVFTRETVLSLARRPDHLIVIGAGATGLALAQGFRRLGSAVTVLDAAEPLGRDEPEAAAIVCTGLEREGVVIRRGVAITRVTTAVGSAAVVVAGPDGAETIAGTHLLVAAGRKPNIDGLGLDKARIVADARGIKVNDALRTRNRRVSAIGDVVAGGPRSAQAARHQASLVLRRALLRERIRFIPELVPRVVFTDPQYAHVGLTEAQARRHGLKFRLLRWPFHDNDRAQAQRTPHGHVKVVAGGDGAILGVTIVGAQASEQIAVWGLAIAQGLTVAAVAGMIMPSPTLMEAGQRAALDFFSPSLTRSWLQRIMTSLRLFG